VGAGFTLGILGTYRVIYIYIYLKKNLLWFGQGLGFLQLYCQEISLQEALLLLLETSLSLVPELKL